MRTNIGYVLTYAYTIKKAAKEPHAETVNKGKTYVYHGIATKFMNIGSRNFATKFAAWTDGKPMEETSCQK